MENKKAIMAGEITTISTTIWRDKNNNCKLNNLPAAVYREQGEMNLLKDRPSHSLVKNRRSSNCTANRLIIKCCIEKLWGVKGVVCVLRGTYPAGGSVPFLICLVCFVASFKLSFV